jgi:hypothetical protein
MKKSGIPQGEKGIAADNQNISLGALDDPEKDVSFGSVGIEKESTL